MRILDCDPGYPLGFGAPPPPPCKQAGERRRSAGALAGAIRHVTRARKP